MVQRQKSHQNLKTQRINLQLFSAYSEFQQRNDLHCVLAFLN